MIWATPPSIWKPCHRHKVAGRSTVGLIFHGGCGHRMVVNRIERKTHILIHAIPLRAILFRAADHRTLQHIGLLLHSRLRCQRPGYIVEISHFISLVLGKNNDGDPALVAVGIAPIGIQRSSCVRFVKAGVGIVRHHGMAGFGADSVSFDRQFITPAFPPDRRCSGYWQPHRFSVRELLLRNGVLFPSQRGQIQSGRYWCPVSRIYHPG